MKDISHDRVLVLVPGNITGWATLNRGEREGGAKPFPPCSIDPDGKEYDRFYNWLTWVRDDMCGLDAVYHDAHQHVDSVPESLSNDKISDHLKFFSKMRDWCSFYGVPCFEVPSGITREGGWIPSMHNNEWKVWAEELTGIYRWRDDGFEQPVWPGNAAKAILDWLISDDGMGEQK